MSAEETENAASELPPEPTADEVISSLLERVGDEQLGKLISACLKAIPRLRAVELMNLYLPTVKLGSSADRGRMGRLLTDGVKKRRDAVLEAVQALARDPFELKTDNDAKDALDSAIEKLNRARAGESDAGSVSDAAQGVAAVLKQALEPDEARRLVLFNAFPDVLDDMLKVIES